MEELNPLLKAIRAFDAADMRDAEYALELATRIVQLRREAQAASRSGANVVTRHQSSDTVASRIESILSDVGTPMTAEQITEKMNSRFGGGIAKASIASALSRSIKSPDSPFARQGQGVFVLRAWNADGNGAGANAPTPF